MTNIYDENNIFAKILRKEIPCEKIYEDQFAFAFKDINPQSKKHILVIPKGAYINVKHFSERASDQEILGFYKAIGKVADLMQVAEDGFRIISNTGSHGRQEVPHFHVHLLAGEGLSSQLVK